jgi:hypothetical protein
MYRLNGKELSDKEFLAEAGEIFCDVMRTMNECDGDMWMSDYQKLMSLFWAFHNHKEND